MVDFNLGRNFDMGYCLYSSIQYNPSEEDLEKTIDSMQRHAIGLKRKMSQLGIFPNCFGDWDKFLY